MSWSQSIYSGQITSAANQYGVPANVLGTQLMQESGLQANPSGGVPGGGIGQFTPSTAASFGLNPLDPNASISAAAQLDAQNYQTQGSWVGAVNQYGTIPTTASTDTSGQAQVRAAALAADNGQSTSDASNPETSYDAMGNPVPTMTVPGDTTMQPTAAPNPSSAVAGTGQSINPLSGLSTLFSDWFTRIVIGILAIGMLIVGFASFKNGALTITPSGVGNAVGKTIK